MKPAILRKPLTLIQGRADECTFYAYKSFDFETGVGELEDLSPYTRLIADFKYDADDTDAVFTLDTQGSTPTIQVVDGGKIKLTFGPEDTQGVVVNASTTLDLPFRLMSFEIKALDADDVPSTILIGSVRVYKGVTTSDEL